MTDKTYTPWNRFCTWMGLAGLVFGAFCGGAWTGVDARQAKWYTNKQGAKRLSAEKEKEHDKEKLGLGRLLFGARAAGPEIQRRSVCQSGQMAFGGIFAPAGFEPAGDARVSWRPQRKGQDR